MFDVLRFFNDHKIGYQPTSVDNRQVKVDCPRCGGVNKVWVTIQSEHYFCHKCKWSPREAEELIGAFVGGRREADRVFHKYDVAGNLDNFEAFLQERLIDAPVRGGIFGERRSQRLLQQPDVVKLPDGFFPLNHPRAQKMARYVKGRNFSVDHLVKKGFGGCAWGKMYGYLIMPVYHQRELVFWQGREALGRKKMLRYRTPRGCSSNNCVYNIEEASKYDEVVICEGLFSALRTGPDAVAVFGNKVGRNQIEILRRHGVRNIVLCFDPDSWQIPESLRKKGISQKPPIYNTTLRLLDRFDRVKLVQLRDGDPDDLGSERMRHHILHAWEIKDVSDFLRFFV